MTTTTRPFDEEELRPIDEELKSLHRPVITICEDDTDSALDGFRVTNSGSVMIPSGFTKPLMMHHQRRSSGTPSTNSSSYGSSAPPDPYQSAYRHSSSLPGSLPRYSAGVPRSLPPTALPRSLPMYYSQHQPISMGMAHHGAPMPHNDSPMPYHGSPMPYHCYPPQYAYQGMNGW